MDNKFVEDDDIIALQRRPFDQELLDKRILLGSQILVERKRPYEKLTQKSVLELPRDKEGGLLAIYDNPLLRTLKVGPGEYLDNGEREDMEGLAAGDFLIADSLVSDVSRNYLMDSKDPEYDGIFVIHYKEVMTRIFPKGDR